MPSTAVERRSAIADFEGRKIDLAQTWDQAEACLVWRQLNALECFRSSGEMERRVGELSSSTLALSATCGSPLKLFEGSAFGGRELWFFDRGYWQNLGDYGFNDQLSSYAVGGCYAHLADYANGGGYWYPGATGPYATEAYMLSSWDERVSSIFIE